MKIIHHSLPIKGLIKIAFLTLIFTSIGFAQFTKPDGYTVEKINIQFDDFQNYSEEAVYAHIKLKEKEPYNQNLVDDSIRALYETGNFNFIAVNQKPLDDSRVEVTFVVTPKLKISELAFSGNQHVSSRKLLKKIDSKQGMPLDPIRLKWDVEKLIEYYHKQGFSSVNVGYEIEREGKFSKVIFKIDEGEKIKITKIQFEGNDHVKTSQLKKVMKTKTWNLFSWLTSSGRFREEVFRDDLDHLKDVYKNEGFLDVVIPEADIAFDYPKDNSMVITIRIEEGRRYYIGDIAFANYTIFSEKELRAVLTLKTDDVFSPKVVDENVEKLDDYYGAVGYLDTHIQAERIPNIQTGKIDLNFVIHESEKFKVETIHIQGNVKTKSNVILRELVLAPGDTFDLVRMKTSQERLINTRYFKDVYLSPEGTPIPGRKDLKIMIKEGHTGNINMGAGFSSVERAVAFVEFSQSNFDLFNYHSWFQGAGQKFRTRLQIGSRSNEVIIQFEEPWVFERELKFGIELFRTTSKYYSSLYHELRLGMEVYFEKRLYELIDGRLAYRLENVNLSHIDSSASRAIKREAGSRSVSKITFSLSRDTRDSFVYPTRGNRWQITNASAGGLLQGQTDYYNFEFRGEQWVPITQNGNHTLGIGGRTGTIIPYSNHYVPIFDRYYLGGPYSLRGFGYRKVGPKDDQGEPIGGDTLAVWNIEYVLKIIDPVRLAAFYDGGFLNAKNLNWSAKHYRDDWGIGLRVFIMGAPLRFDLAFPIHKDKSDDNKKQFYFSFGTVF